MSACTRCGDGDGFDRKFVCERCRQAEIDTESRQPDEQETDEAEQGLPPLVYFGAGWGQVQILWPEFVATVSRLTNEQADVLARALSDEALLSALCALKDERRSRLLAELRRDDSAGKYFAKARVYGAIASHHRLILKKLAQTVPAAKDALSWPTAEGVPQADLDAFERTMRAEQERDAAIAQAESAEKSRNDICSEATKLRARVSELEAKLSGVEARANLAGEARDCAVRNNSEWRRWYEALEAKLAAAEESVKRWALLGGTDAENERARADVARRQRAATSRMFAGNPRDMMTGAQAAERVRRMSLVTEAQQEEKPNGAWMVGGNMNRIWGQLGVAYDVATRFSYQFAQELIATEIASWSDDSESRLMSQTRAEKTGICSIYDDRGTCTRLGLAESFRRKSDGEVRELFTCEEHRGRCNDQWEPVAPGGKETGQPPATDRAWLQQELDAAKKRIAELECQVKIQEEVTKRFDAECTRLHAKCSRQRKELRRLNRDVLIAKSHEQYNRTKRKELESNIAAIFRDYQIEGDVTLRDIIERTTAAACKFREELSALRAEEAPEKAWERAQAASAAVLNRFKAALSRDTFDEADCRTSYQPPQPEPSRCSNPDCCECLDPRCPEHGGGKP